MTSSTPPQLSFQAPKPPIWDRISRITGLDYEAPMGAMDNIRETLGFATSARNGVGKIMSLSDIKN